MNEQVASYNKVRVEKTALIASDTVSYAKSLAAKPDKMSYMLRTDIIEEQN